MVPDHDSGETLASNGSNPTAKDESDEKIPSENASESNPKCPFEPIQDQPLPPDFAPQDERWLNMLSSPCLFPTDIFNGVMYNLVKNPNITSSHLFRADISYDSDADRLNHSGSPEDGLIKHLRPEYRPIPARWPGFTLTRTLVRQLIPRNPKLDRPLLQTCHFLSRERDDVLTDTLVLYIPHVSHPSEVPFYHPSVSRLAFLHHPPNPSRAAPGTISILFLPFPPPPPSLPRKLHRTALSLLSTLHKHGHGQLAGYVKRVHHDLLVPQRRYQTTYARLKAHHGRALAESWAEVTDPGKHVFEDLGIAAFLIELWREMYADFPLGGTSPSSSSSSSSSSQKPKWKGFLDIGCGNGLLTHVLLSEGCGPGWGFDARERKGWGGFLREHPGALRRRVLVPGVLSSALPEAKGGGNSVWYDGVSGAEGWFVVSNHADQLTLWTPLLAGLGGGGFVAIPCCSHDFAGGRFRAPGGGVGKGKRGEGKGDEGKKKRAGAAEEGSLARDPKAKAPSAYASLCSYVEELAGEVGFEAEVETLRIPSTRNVCIVGRRWKERDEKGMGSLGEAERRARVVEIVERESKRGIGDVAEEWVRRAEGLMKKPGSGH